MLREFLCESREVTECGSKLSRGRERTSRRQGTGGMWTGFWSALGTMEGGPWGSGMIHFVLGQSQGHQGGWSGEDHVWPESQGQAE